MMAAKPASAATRLLKQELHSAWDQKFAELRAFKEQHGHCNVPKGKAAGPFSSLGNWVTKRRVEYRKGTMPQEKVARLEELGIEWDPHSHSWEEKFAQLKAYHRENGHCNVPRTNAHLQLGRWVATQRFEYRKNALSADRVHKLESLGMQWGYLNLTWEERYQQLLQYHKEHGHCNVPKGSEQLELGSWLSDQRWKYRQGSLPEDKACKLEALGIQWNRLQCVWDERYAELKAFHKEHGHCEVPRSQNGTLGLLRNWISTQRREHKRGALLPDRQASLEALGMTFSARASCSPSCTSSLASPSTSSGDSRNSDHTRDQQVDCSEEPPHKKRKTEECTSSEEVGCPPWPAAPHQADSAEEGAQTVIYKPMPRRPIRVVVDAAARDLSHLHRRAGVAEPRPLAGGLSLQWRLNDLLLRTQVARMEASMSRQYLPFVAPSGREARLLVQWGLMP